MDCLHIRRWSGRRIAICDVEQMGRENKRLIKRQYDIHDFWWSPLSHALLVVVEIDRPKDRLENWEVTG